MPSLKKGAQKSTKAHVSKSLFMRPRWSARIWVAVVVIGLLIVGGGFFFRYSKAAVTWKRLDIHRVAKSQLGYKEWDAQTLAYTGGVRDAWCAYFVSWVFKQSGFPLTAQNNGRVPLAWKPYGVSIREVFQSKNAFHAPQKGGGYQAVMGDVVVFGEERSHVGIVSEYSWSDKGFRLVAIEGNSNIQGSPDRVVERTYTDPNVAKIMGFGNANAFIDAAAAPKR